MRDPAVLQGLRASIQRIEAQQSSTTVTDSPVAHDVDADATEDPAAAKAFTFLVRSTQQRPITQAEAAAKLAARGYEEDIVAHAVARAVAAKLLDDRAFATAWVGDRGVKRGYGRDRLRRELRRRKVPDDLIDEALHAVQASDERANAIELARARAQRMPATLEPHRVAQRLVGFLVRRGYDSGTAHEVARSVTALDRGWD